jgi:hypothetical protein
VSLIAPLLATASTSLTIAASSPPKGDPSSESTVSSIEMPMSEVMLQVAISCFALPSFAYNLQP